MKTLDPIVDLPLALIMQVERPKGECEKCDGPELVIQDDHAYCPTCGHVQELAA